MIRSAIILIFFNIFSIDISAVNTNKYGYKSDFYKAISSNDTQQINKQLKLLSVSAIDEKEAYTGALLMKKAGLVKSAGKLRLFMEGKKSLETAISKELKNGEYRFLRLLIQENCPPILKYNNRIKEDVQKVRDSFKLFDPELKSAIRNYCKYSKNLKEEDL